MRIFILLTAIFYLTGCARTEIRAIQAMGEKLEEYEELDSAFYRTSSEKGQRIVNRNFFINREFTVIIARKKYVVYAFDNLGSHSDTYIAAFNKSNYTDQFFSIPGTLSANRNRLVHFFMAKYPEKSREDIEKDQAYNKTISLIAKFKQRVRPVGWSWAYRFSREVF